MTRPHLTTFISPRSAWQSTLVARLPAVSQGGEIEVRSAESLQAWQAGDQTERLASLIELADPTVLVEHAEAIAATRRRQPRVPILALTFSALAFARLDLLAAGCTWVVTRPDELERLLARIDPGRSNARAKRIGTETLGEQIDRQLPWPQFAEQTFSAE